MREPVTTTTAMRTFADELADARARLFVGREAELRLLAALLEPSSERRVAAVSGPGGIGKTELLTAFARDARARGVRVAWIDGAHVAVSEAALTEAVSAELAGEAPAVLVIDRFELLAPLETWLRERMLPSLPADVRVVVAGRAPLASAWSSSAAWSSLIEPIALGDLAQPAAAEYLARRGVPSARQADIVRVTGGHPLALGLFAEVALRDPKRRIDLGGEPAVVQALLENLLQGVPDDLHRQALWSSALVRHTTEEALAAMVDKARAPALFGWLRQLSFMRAAPTGLAPHDLVRDLLTADLAWRYPHLRLRMLARAAKHFRSAMQSNPRARTALVMDVAFLWRAEVPLAGFDTGGLYTSAPRAGDWPTLEAMLAALHGPSAPALLRHWVEREGELVVVRGADEQPQALALYLWVERVSPADRAADPVVASLCAYLEARGELTGAVCWRFLVDKDTLERPSASTAVLTAYEFEHFVCRPEVSDGYGVCIDLEAGLQTLPPGMLVRCPEADCAIEGREYRIIRTVAAGRSQLEWCLDGLFGPLAVDDGVVDALDRATFETSARHALRDFHKPERLATNALLRSRVVADGGAPATTFEAVEALRRVLREAAVGLGEGDDDQLDRVVIEQTFFVNRAKQLRVAMDLNLPFGSYRRRLGSAAARLIARLWLREVPAGA